MSRTRRWVIRLGLMASFSLMFVSCGAQTAEEACEEYRALANEIASVCTGYGFPTYGDIWLTWVDGPCEGRMTSCEYVHRIKAPREFTDGCLPAMQTATCDEYAAFAGDLQLCLEQFEGPQGADRTACSP